MNWKLPVPQPRTPLSANVKAFRFGDRLHRQVAMRLNRRGHAQNARVKTHRDSRAVVWKGLPFYWTSKGFYRGGSHGNRRPLQWLVWQDATGQTIPRGHVVVFPTATGTTSSRPTLRCARSARSVWRTRGRVTRNSRMSGGRRSAACGGRAGPAR